MDQCLVNADDRLRRMRRRAVEAAAGTRTVTAAGMRMRTTMNKVTRLFLISIVLF